MLSSIPWQVYAVILFALSLPLLAKFAEQLRRQRRLERAGLHDLHRMGGEQFDRYLERLFRGLGYQVQRPPGRGADLVLVSGTGGRTAVLSRHWQEAVDAPVVAKAVEGAEALGCQEVLVVTTVRFRNQAIGAAEKQQVLLWDLADLAGAMVKIGQRQGVRGTVLPDVGQEPPGGPALPVGPVVSPGARVAPPVPARPVVPQGSAVAQLRSNPEPGLAASRIDASPPCPRCGAPTLARQAAGRSIWLCSRFPKCNGARLR